METMEQVQTLPAMEDTLQIGHGSNVQNVAEPMKAMFPKVCKVDGCSVPIDNLKPYYQRHRLCMDHYKADVCKVNGQQVRFCQKCAKFHDLSEFDGMRRSCRLRLYNHNRRRTKLKNQQAEARQNGPKIATVTGATVREQVNPLIHENVNASNIQQGQLGDGIDRNEVQYTASGQHILQAIDYGNEYTTQHTKINEDLHQIKVRDGEESRDTGDATAGAEKLSIAGVSMFNEGGEQQQGMSMQCQSKGIMEDQGFKQEPQQEAPQHGQPAPITLAQLRGLLEHINNQVVSGAVDELSQHHARIDELLTIALAQNQLVGGDNTILEHIQKKLRDMVAILPAIYNQVQTAEVTNPQGLLQEASQNLASVLRLFGSCTHDDAIVIPAGNGHQADQGEHAVAQVPGGPSVTNSPALEANHHQQGTMDVTQLVHEHTIALQEGQGRSEQNIQFIPTDQIENMDVVNGYVPDNSQEQVVKLQLTSLVLPTSEGQVLVADGGSAKHVDHSLAGRVTLSDDVNQSLANEKLTDAPTTPLSATAVDNKHNFGLRTAAIRPQVQNLPQAHYLNLVDSEQGPTGAFKRKPSGLGGSKQPSKRLRVLPSGQGLETEGQPHSAPAPRPNIAAQQGSPVGMVRSELLHDQNCDGSEVSNILAKTALQCKVPIKQAFMQLEREGRLKQGIGSYGKGATFANLDNQIPTLLAGLKDQHNDGAAHQIANVLALQQQVNAMHGNSPTDHSAKVASDIAECINMLGNFKEGVTFSDNQAMQGVDNVIDKLQRIYNGLQGSSCISQN